MERRRFKRETPLDQRLEDHAKRLRKEAKGTPAGILTNMPSLEMCATRARSGAACSMPMLDDGFRHVAGALICIARSSDPAVHSAH